MEEKLLELYRQRLSNFEQTLLSLHEYVGTDESIRLLGDGELLRFKIDRVQEIVKEVLRGEREGVLTGLLVRCCEFEERDKIWQGKEREWEERERLSEKERGKEGRKDERGGEKEDGEDYKEIAEVKVMENERLTKEVRMLTMKLSEYEAASRLATSAASGTSAASAALAGKVETERVTKELIKSSKADTERIALLETELTSVNKTFQERESSIRKEYADKVQNLEQTITEVTVQLSQSQTQLRQKESELLTLSSEREQFESQYNELLKTHHNTLQLRQTVSHGHQINRSEQIATVKQELFRLTTQLQELQQSYTIIREQVLRQLYGEVKQVKQGIMVLKQGIKNEIEANRSEICDVVEVRIQELMMKVMGQRNRKEEGRMVVRVNEIDNELADFIEKYVEID